MDKLQDKEIAMAKEEKLKLQQQKKSKWEILNKIIFNLLLFLGFIAIIFSFTGRYSIAILLAVLVLIFGFSYLLGLLIGVNLMKDYTSKVIEETIEEFPEKFINNLFKKVKLEELSEECIEELLKIIEKAENQK